MVDLTNDLWFSSTWCNLSNSKWPVFKFPFIQELLQLNACKLESSQEGDHQPLLPRLSWEMERPNKKCAYDTHNIYICIHTSFFAQLNSPSCRSCTLTEINSDPEERKTTAFVPKLSNRLVCANRKISVWSLVTSIKRFQKNNFKLRFWYLSTYTKSKKKLPMPLGVTQICTVQKVGFSMVSIPEISGRWTHGWQVWKARRTKPMAIFYWMLVKGPTKKQGLAAYCSPEISRKY